MVNENLSILHPYFDAISRGVKTVEYRDMTPYYIEKFVDMEKYNGKSADEIAEILRKGGKFYPRKVDTITFFCNDRQMVVEVLDIKVYSHHTTFAIKLGRKVV